MVHCNWALTSFWCNAVITLHVLLGYPRGFCHYHTEAQTKWPTFYRRHFQMQMSSDVTMAQWFIWVLTTLIHWDRLARTYVSKLTIIVSDNGLSPSRRQAIIWTNAGILLIGPLGTKFSEILIEIRIGINSKMSTGKWRPYFLGLNVLKMLIKTPSEPPPHFWFSQPLCVCLLKTFMDLFWIKLLPCLQWNV